MTDDQMIDLTKDRATLRALYTPSAGNFSMVDVPKLPFAVVDGTTPPQEPAINAAVKALYSAIYPIRREARTRMGKSFVEAPVEILYWADDMRDLAAGNREKWHWRVQITLPVWADEARLEQSMAEMADNLGDGPTPRWEAIAEGTCVQRLHVGDTSGLPAILAGLYGEYLPKERLEPAGPYHEIYLDDWSRVAPHQRRIVVRQPVRRSAQA